MRRSFKSYIIVIQRERKESASRRVCRHRSFLITCMVEFPAEGPEGESDLSIPLPLPPFSVESISRRPKLTRFIQLKPPFFFI